VAIVIAVVLVASDLAQLYWFGKRSNPDHGPLRREHWERTTAGAVRPGDVVLASSLSPNPETVVEVTTAGDGSEQLVMRFRSGKVRTTPPTTPLRRHRHTPDP
jgi:hypothetical protein